MKINVPIFRNFFIARTRSSNARNSNQVPRRYFTIFLPGKGFSHKNNRPCLPFLEGESMPQTNNLCSAALRLRCAVVMIQGARGTSVTEEEQRHNHTPNCICRHRLACRHLNCLGVALYWFLSSFSRLMWRQL